MSTNNLWGRFRSAEVKHDLETATRIAVGTCARRMLGEESPAAGLLSPGGGAGFTTGLTAIRRFAEDLPSWAKEDDVSFLASYNASAIEKFGNGGGSFRRMYSRFLDWAHERYPACVPAEAAPLAWRAADGWTALAHVLWANSEGADRWDEAARQAAEIAEIERELFERLAQNVPPAP